MFDFKDLFLKKRFLSESCVLFLFCINNLSSLRLAKERERERVRREEERAGGEEREREEREEGGRA